METYAVSWGNAIPSSFIRRHTLQGRLYQSMCRVRRGSALSLAGAPAVLRGGCAACPAVCGSATGCGDGATCATPVAGAEAGAFGAGVPAVDGYTGSMLALPGSTAIPGLLTPASWHGLTLKKRPDKHACPSECSNWVRSYIISSILALPASTGTHPLHAPAEPPHGTATSGIADDGLVSQV